MGGGGVHGMTTLLPGLSAWPRFKIGLGEYSTSEFSSTSQEKKFEILALQQIFHELWPYPKYVSLYIIHFIPLAGAVFHR